MAPKSARSLSCFVVTVVVALLCLPQVSQGQTLGDIDCLVCTALLDIAEQLAVIHEIPIETFIKQQFCTYFTGDYRSTCQAFISIFGNAIIQGFVNHENADDICHGIQLCTDPTCRLFTPQQAQERVAGLVTHMKQTSDLHWKSLLNQSLQKKDKILSSFNMKPGESPWQWIVDLIIRLVDKHEPVLDLDGDLFGLQETLRGTTWRGRDCNDADASIYPGRKTNPYPNNPGLDYNCNGISGVAPGGKSWKQTLCDKSGQMGVVVLGDSAGAHFAIDPQYFHPPSINLTTYQNLGPSVEDELDLPYRSGFTGFDTSVPPMRSLYKYMYERNRCNHRDYHNLAVNGGDSGNTLQHMQTLRRNGTNDHPVLMVMELIGNDVCSPSHTPNTMTDPTVFKANIYKVLSAIDAAVPKGSHMMLFGLVDGRILYNILHDRIHPIGVTYAQLYSFISCTYINPCWIWLNKNETLRNMGSERAFELNAKYQEIMNETRGQMKNFDFAYYDIPVAELMDDYARHGGDVVDLIEPTDGFHPSGVFHALFADWIWKKLNVEHPTWIGNVNPNNDLIKQLFGDQGGY